MTRQLKTFVLHDSSVNTYGFRMMTGGCDLSEFRKNPIMLFNHNDWEMPIGRWDNIRVEGDRILADADFDLEDERGREIARKVESGYLSACSVGAWVSETSSDPALMLEGQSGATVTSWTLREASICNIGANHNALVLYDAMGAKVQEADYSTVLELCDGHQEQTPIITPNIIKIMKDEIAKVLGLSESTEESALIAAVSKLRDELKGYRQREAEALHTEAVALTDEAIREGRLDASAREATLRLFAADHESAKAMLTALPRPANVEEAIRTASDDRTDALRKLAAKSWDELDRSGQLETLRDGDPDAYEAKYKERFGTRK